MLVTVSGLDKPNKIRYNYFSDYNPATLYFNVQRRSIMINNMLKIDEAILESNKIICRQISRLGSSTRGEVSQEILESLRHFVEHI